MNWEKIPELTHTRMIRLFIILNRMDDKWDQILLSSADLGRVIGSTADTIRKDLSILGCSASGRAYKVSELLESMREKLNLQQDLSAGLAGLDSWGGVLLKNPESIPGIKITAAFDSSQNRIERTESRLPLHPSYEIKEVFEREKIRIGILANDATDPERILKRMLEGGAWGIMNLTSCPLKVPEHVFYHQADMTAGFLSIVSLINGVKNKK